MLVTDGTTGRADRCFANKGRDYPGRLQLSAHPVRKAFLLVRVPCRIDCQAVFHDGSGWRGTGAGSDLKSSKACTPGKLFTVGRSTHPHQPIFLSSSSVTRLMPRAWAARCDCRSLGGLQDDCGAASRFDSARQNPGAAPMRANRLPGIADRPGNAPTQSHQMTLPIARATGYSPYARRPPPLPISG